MQIINNEQINLTQNKYNSNDIKFNKCQIKDIDDKLITSKNEIIKKRRFRQKYSKWTLYEDDKLIKILKNSETKNWDKISENFEGKSSRNCKYRWYKNILPNIQNKEWSKEEDAFIANFIAEFGIKNWTICSKFMNTDKSPKNCKERWYDVILLKYKPYRLKTNKNSEKSNILEINSSKNFSNIACLDWNSCNSNHLNRDKIIFRICNSCLTKIKMYIKKKNYF